MYVYPVSELLKLILGTPKTLDTRDSKRYKVQTKKKPSPRLYHLDHEVIGHLKKRKRQQEQEEEQNRTMIADKRNRRRRTNTKTCR